MTILTSAEAQVQLETLTSNLSFVSESDFPLTVTRLGDAVDLDARTLLAAVGKPPTSLVEEGSVDELFAYPAQEQSWHTAEERAVASRYQSLLEFLTTSLEGSRVFRVGSSDIDVYAVGKSADGQWLGIATKLVET